MKKVLAASALLFASSGFAAAAPSLTGKWTVHNNIAGNESDQECNFVQTESKLTGTCKGAEKEVAITGSVDSNKLTWKYEFEYNGSPLTLTYTASLGDSGKIAGSVDVDPYGVTGEFTAKPVEAAGK